MATARMTSHRAETAKRQRSIELGRFVVKTEWRGKMFLYDVLAKSTGLLVACGLEMLSRSEHEALAGVEERLCGKKRTA